jgi:hypothetical protein
MRQGGPKAAQGRAYRLSLAGYLGLCIGLLLLTAAPASAALEQVGHFAEKEEAARLYRATGMAVNITGAGGVPPGTVYLSGYNSEIIRYDPDGEFSEAWGWNVSEGGTEQFERCGPDGEAAHPHCRIVGNRTDGGKGGEGVGQLASPEGIAVDQTTGYVYVENHAGRPPTFGERGKNVIEVFSADGSQVITEFGEAGAFLETFAEGPGMLHGSTTSGIVVDDSGTVYVSDHKIATNESPSHESRIMSFKPLSSGDYEHYAYTGRQNDINGYAGHLAGDPSGDIYSASETEIDEFSPGGSTGPVCSYRFPNGGINSLAVDPATEEPLFFTYKSKTIELLSACNPEGKFVSTGSISPEPGPSGNYPLAYNPNLSFSSGREPGVLYGADTSEYASENLFGVGDIFAPAAIFPPTVESESVRSVSSSSAGLTAQINPKGFETTYLFQYLTEAEYQANEPTNRFAGAAETVAGRLAPGQASVAVAATVTGLAPDTEYRYRVVATSNCQPGDPCETPGMDKAFRTFPMEPSGSPDNRAYELVSPVLKSGGEVFPLDPSSASCGIECKPGASGQTFPRQSAPDGEAVVYEGQPFSTIEGANVYNEYLSKRTSSGWQTTILAPRLMGSNGQGYKLFNTDLTQGVLYQTAPSLTPDAPSELANIYTQPTASPATLDPLVQGLPPNRSTGAFQLAYAGASSDFSRQFFAANDALTGETPFAPEAVDPGEVKKNLYEEAGGELRLVNVLPGNTQTAPGAHFGTPAINVGNFDNSISDTSHAISDDGSKVFWSVESGQVYVRIDGETTIEIPDPAKFLTASADGSKVLLQDGCLYSLASGECQDLTTDENGVHQGGFLGILGQSEDLSHVYFVDTAVLTGEAENQYGAKAQPGKINLYAWQDGTPTFIATLLAEDNVADGGDWHFSPAQRTAEASPDGNLLAFLSGAPLSGDESGGRSEVFLYDSATDELGCPSCNPSGEAPLGPSSLPLAPQLTGEDPQPQARYLTDEGRLYFDSQDSLTPYDTNDGVEDVYQYEPDGIGTCVREAGCVNLISAGHEPIDSNFLAVDATGKNVFFTTRDQLVLKDKDELVDLYDAREGGGIASETETARSECQGEACQPAVSPPNDPTPGSSTFEGAGNLNEKKSTTKEKKKPAKKHKKNRRGHTKKKKHTHKRAARHNRGGNR